jgi:hypothetical protein
MFFDDVRLYRPCDVDLECWPAHGQICPDIATPLPPADPMRVLNIANADRLELELYAQNGALVFQDFRANANGMPDYTLSRLALPAGIASGTYGYRVTLRNGCGGTVREGLVSIQDTTIYNLPPLWEDSEHNWTGVPIPCCLDSLVIANTTIRGDVSYIVGDLIVVGWGVSAAPNSNVTLQAGQVVELYDVEFDGSTSTVEIVEVPCPNRVAQGSCTGGSMVIDAGQPKREEKKEPKSSQAQAMSEANHFEVARPSEPEVQGLQVSPNPTKGLLEIGWTSAQDGLSTAMVLDMQGRQLLSLLDAQEMKAGSHSIQADLSALPQGMYLLRVQSGEKVWLRKVVKE